MHFLNVDLVIESKHDLSPLVEEFGEDVHVLHHGPMRGLNHLVVESTESCGRDVEGVMSRLYILVRDLPSHARAIWDNCCTRTFDIGYDAGDSPETLRSELRSATLQSIAEIGGSIMITIYPPNRATMPPESSEDRKAE